MATEIEQKPPLPSQLPPQPRHTIEGKSQKVEIHAPETDEVMYVGKDHAGINSLAKPFHYRGQIFGVGDHVDSVLKTIEKWEKRLKEGNR